MEAAQAGKDSLVELLLDSPLVSHTHVNACSGKSFFSPTQTMGELPAQTNCSALLLASRYGHANVVSLFLSSPKCSWAQINGLVFIENSLEKTTCYSSAVNTPNSASMGQSCLMQAVLGGHREVVQRLLASDRVDAERMINARYEGGWTLLMKASECGHSQVVEELLKSGRVTDDHINAQKNKYVEWIALMYACYDGHDNVVQVLLESPRVPESHVNHADVAGWTSLMKAAQHGHHENIRLLLQSPKVSREHVNAEAKKYGYTALMLAALSGCRKSVTYLLDSEKISDEHINAKNNYGCTAFMLAASLGRKFAVEVFLEHHKISTEYLELRNKDNATALELADQTEHFDDIVEIIRGRLNRVST
jgi:ankyrin repeat protein